MFGTLIGYERAAQQDCMTCIYLRALQDFVFWIAPYNYRVVQGIARAIAIHPYMGRILQNIRAKKIPRYGNLLNRDHTSLFRPISDVVSLLYQKVQSILTFLLKSDYRMLSSYNYSAFGPKKNNELKYYYKFSTGATHR